jgi:hypothetical protein
MESGFANSSEQRGIDLLLQGAHLKAAAALVEATAAWAELLRAEPFWR